MLKPDPNIRRFRWLGLLEIGVGALYLICFILGSALSHEGIHDWWIVFFGPYFIVLGICMLVIGPRAVRRLDQRRHMAAYGEVGAAPLAAQQPDWDANALPLPLTIVMQPSRRLLLVPIALCSIVLVFGLGLAYGLSARASMSSGAHHTSGVILAAVIVVPLLLVFLMMGIMLYIMWRQRIVITEDGLTVHGQGRTTAIRWDEAGLFAIVTIGRTRRPLPPLMYELSGEQSVVRWFRMWPERKLRVMEPVLPWPEYERQMEALLRVIAGRTHLPLYDLREPPKRSAHASDGDDVRLPA